jgi:hypothetical protein
MKLVLLSLVAILVVLMGSFPSLGKIETAAAFGRTSEVSDKVYSSDEVDKPAEITNFDSILPAFKKSLNCDGDGVVKASYVLRKNGKVTDIKVENTMPCKGKEKAPNVLRRI